MSYRIFLTWKCILCYDIIVYTIILKGFQLIGKGALFWLKKERIQKDEICLKAKANVQMEPICTDVQMSSGKDILFMPKR